MLPQKCRAKVLELAHQIPLAGHLGRDKTADRLLYRFYWPTLYKDVGEYCRQCEVCHKTRSRKPRRAPLIPLPIRGALSKNRYGHSRPIAEVSKRSSI